MKVKSENQKCQIIQINVFKVVEIEGKGLGCFATMDIKRVSLIFNKYTKICANSEKSTWVQNGSFD